MMSNRPYMPLFVADYLSATQHLNAAESGAYLHLIMHYWTKGSLPQDDKFLARIARMTDRQWESAKPTIKAFFRDDWTHERVEKEIAHAKRKGEARAECGSRGGTAKALKTKEAGLAKANISLQQTASKTPSEPLASSSGTEEISNDISKQSSLRSDCLPQAAKPAKPSPKSELAKAIGNELAAEVVDHRNRMRKPLTPQSAARLAEQFVATGKPQEAARMMIDRAWQGFNREWFENARARDGPPSSVPPFPKRRQNDPHGPDRSAFAAACRQLDAINRGEDPYAAIRARLLPSEDSDVPRSDIVGLLPQGRL